MTTMTREEQKQVLIDTANHIINRNNTSPYSENLRELARIALASLEAEPVLYQSCTRPTWNSGVPWTEWKERSREGYEDDLRFTDTPDHAGWINKCRKLYTTPPVPVIQADVAQAIENLKQKLVECNRYNYCADAVKGVEDACRAVMLQSGNFREIAETSTNSPVIPGEVLSAILKFARVRADFDDFDGDRRGIGDCLDETEQELIVTINKYASQLAAEPIAPNDVREQTAIPQVPVTPDSWISCSERMPDKLIPVMVMYEDGEMWSAMWNGNRWDDGTEYPDPHSVTHWREMPAAPQQEVK